jgi:hypothetical protein
VNGIGLNALFAERLLGSRERFIPSYEFLNPRLQTRIHNWDQRPNLFCFIPDWSSAIVDEKKGRLRRPSQETLLGLNL